ncbi:MAG TPA: hypothetical protein PKD24_06155 [Pyrinomonadaceae bacterium]|nr:hypothetical protein [Pyrinomonadaceae bacterium]HMP65261.1 hypothetical protein [Pyrinomonadaceae bacterium]
MINIEPDISLDEIAEKYARAFGHYDRGLTSLDIHVRFYPYVGINHTIRVRKGSVFVRLAEICWDMGPDVHEALAYILVSKLYRRKAPKWARETYDSYIKSEKLVERSAADRKARGRKRISGPVGEIYDLNEIFDDLNTKYLDSTLSRPVLTWSTKRTYRILGQHDATHDTIVISRSLDTDRTPRYVVEFVLFHEMLHIVHPTVHHNGRRYNHTAAFRRDEEKFRYYTEAERWIEENVARLKRAARRG